MKAHKILPGAKSLSRILDISPEARKRLKWFEWHNVHGRSSRLTCRHFGISPDTFYRWKRRFKSGCLKTLENISSKPKTFRISSISYETVHLLTKLRKEDMGLSKYKLSRILARDYSIALSPSSIGRILKNKGLIAESEIIKSVKRRKRINYIIPRLRAARELRYRCPGYLVQVDTKHLIVLGQPFYQFTAIDCYTKISFSKIYRNITSANGKDFLESITGFFPFPVKAIQTDNGSEYLLHFHKYCIEKGITHYFSHPHTPKDNALVERLIQTTEYELWLFDETLIPELSYLSQKVSWWIGRYNTYRPHQSLNYLTPMEYYQKKGGNVYGR